MKRLCLIMILFTGCANMPTQYGQYVLITGGLYKGERGRMVKDCSGFESYKVVLSNNKSVCVNIWNLERL